MYFIPRTIAKCVVCSFFREITVLNSERIPVYGPVIFVGNHSNQFVDGSMLLAILPRHVRFLMAEKSLKRPIIGFLAQQTGSISVARPQDKVYSGTIHWKTDSTLIEGIGTRFLLDMHAGDRIRLVTCSLEVTVKEVLSDSQLVVCEPLPEMKVEAARKQGLPKFPSSESKRRADEKRRSSLDCQGTDSNLMSTTFQVLPRVDQSDVYEAVAEALISGDSIGIFPEGGSHDRPEMLPLKPGVAIMALQAAAEGAQDVLVVPLGLNYYQAHKILSRAIIQVGAPIVIEEELLALYKRDRRAAVSQLLNEIEQNLKSCVVSSPNYTLLKATRLCTTLYAPESVYLQTDRYHILYHQFTLLFNKHRDDVKVQDFTLDIQQYAQLLKGYGIADHEVRQLKQTVEGAILSLFELVFVFLISVLIGVSLSPFWGPIRLLSSHLAEKHRRKALAESKVKILGRDVVASYKILTLMVLVPTANLIYSFIFGMLYCHTWPGVLNSILLGLIVLPCLYYYSIRYWANIRPLLRKFKFISLVLVSKLNAWRDTEREIITRRMKMQLAVRQLAKEFGPLTRAGFMTEMDRCVPTVVLEADSKRIQRRLENGEFVPFTTRTVLDSREEIL